MPAPSRVNILGVGISAIDMAQALDIIGGWILHRDPHYICVSTVHGVMECQKSAPLRRLFNASGLTTPDGMPLVWISRLRGFSHVRRVYGPDLMLALCEQSLSKGYRHYFYGGREGVAGELKARLEQRFPGLRVVGTQCPPFSALTPAEDIEVCRQIREARPDIVWVGMSTPKQDVWSAEHVERLNVPVIIGVGAAFDFLSGRKKQAPRWMRQCGLEWLFRLIQEPRRLWRRYLVYNPLFVLKVIGQTMGLRRYTLE